ncbi:MAG: hypothetical protein J0L57_05320 [Burkholderiales bacterium]|nr:hypothetical protein [Burkholderiales bacterium]
MRCTYMLDSPSEDVFDFDLYVSIWHEADEYLRERGVRVSYSRMTRFNTASHNAHLRLGSNLIGHALFLQAWCLEVMLATVAPFFAMTWATGRVRLRIPGLAPAMLRTRADCRTSTESTL